MSAINPLALVRRLAALPRETEWVEFKENNSKPDEIGSYLSGLANSACLEHQEHAYLVFGVRNASHELVGTKFDPKATRVGNEELENWLLRLLDPRIDFRVLTGTEGALSFRIFQIQPAHGQPVSFKGTAYVRVGSYLKKLSEFPEKERRIWLGGVRTPFERGLASCSVSGAAIFELLDIEKFFQLLQLELPVSERATCERLVKESMITARGDDLHDITNLGALLFARRLTDFPTLRRKAVRVVHYRGKNRLQTQREQQGVMGYACGFEGLVRYINNLLPVNEQIGEAFRQERRMYPEIAVRELVANAIIHQDFSATGDSPLVEIFDDRIEFTNHGKPLLDVLRLIDEPPQSRNEELAAFMRRIGICEERGSGIDKVVAHVEVYQLPAPDFLVTENYTKIVVYGLKSFASMDKKSRIRACYQHACLRYVSADQMTNSSLRSRFALDDKNYPIVSRIISDTAKDNLIKSYDPSSQSKKHARYVPFWA